MRLIILTACFVLAAGNALAEEAADGGAAELATDAAKIEAAVAEAEAKDAEADSTDTKDKKEEKADAEAAAEPTDANTPATEPAAEETDASSAEPVAEPAPVEPAATEPATPAETAAKEPTAAAAEPSPESADSTPAVAATVETGETSPAIERSGIYFGLGLGAGAGNLSDETLAGPSSGMLLIRGGLSLGNQLQVGGSLALIGQWNTWTEREHAGSAMSSLLVEATYYPIASVPWGITGGAGWGSAMRVDRVADKNKDSPRVIAASGNGVSFMGATSFDLTKGPGANFGVQLRYDGASLGDLGLVNVGTLGLWLNWY